MSYDIFCLVAASEFDPSNEQYSRSYYRATYVNTAFDAGFASAMTIRPKWLKDLCSVLFSFYYLLWATEGDEVVCSSPFFHQQRPAVLSVVSSY